MNDLNDDNDDRPRRTGVLTPPSITPSPSETQLTRHYQGKSVRFDLENIDATSSLLREDELLDELVDNSDSNASQRSLRKKLLLVFLFTFVLMFKPSEAIFVDYILVQHWATKQTVNYFNFNLITLMIIIINFFQ